MTTETLITSAFDGYVACALWSSTDDTDESGGEPLDRNYDASDIAGDSRDAMLRDVAAFVAGLPTVDLTAALDHMSPSRLGHDFWLTRNHHGAGFWDGELGALGDRLTDASHAYGEASLYVGDDGQVHYFNG